MPEPSSPGGGPPLHREPSDVGARGLLVFSISLLLTVGGIMLVAKVVLDRLVASRPQPVAPVAAVGPSLLPPAPRLQVSPAEDLREMRQREEREMASYAWEDRPAGFIRIPLERALEIVARQGVPSWSPPAVTPPAAPGKEKGR